MKVAELIEQLEQFPGDAEIYVNADHGQSSERAYSVDFSCTAFDNAPHCADDELNFDPDEHEDEDAAFDMQNATAVRIMS